MNRTEDVEALAAEMHADITQLVQDVGKDMVRESEEMYRTAYTDGWHDATEALRAIGKGKASFEKVCAILSAHYARLEIWKAGSTSKDTDPPRFMLPEPS